MTELIENEPSFSPIEDDKIIKFKLIPESEEENEELDGDDPFASEKEDSIVTEREREEDLEEDGQFGCEQKVEEVNEELECEPETHEELSLSEPSVGAELIVKVFIPMVSNDLFHVKIEEPLHFSIKRLYEKLLEDQETAAAFDSTGNFIGNVYLNRRKINDFDCCVLQEEFDAEKDLIIMIHELIKCEEAEESEEINVEQPVRVPSKSLMSRFKNLWTGKPTSDNSKTTGNVPQQAMKASLVFGKPIEELKRCPESGLPQFISDVLNYLREPSQVQEGLFRLSGTFTKIQSVQERIDDGCEWGELKLTPLDCHNVTSLFKQFLRNLPEPLMTFELYEGWQALGGSTEHPEVVVKIARFLVNRLPELNLLVLRELMTFLHGRLKDSEVTRMNACNYGTVIGPNLLWNLKEDRNTRDSTTLGLSLQSSTLASQICTLFLQYYEDIFEKEDEVNSVLAYAKVLYDFEEENSSGSCTLLEDEIVFITGIEDSIDGWWRGYLSTGLEVKFPSNYVKVIRQCSDAEIINQKLS